MSNLATVYKDLGEYNKAAQLLEKALDSDQNNFGDKHPTVAIRMWNLGSVYIDLKLPEKAKKMIATAYPIFVNNLGVDHPTTKNCKNWLDGVEKILTQKNNPR